jgi:hypothetical protein
MVEFLHKAIIRFGRHAANRRYSGWPAQNS